MTLTLAKHVTTYDPSRETKILVLPAELRNKIHRHVLVDSEPILLRTAGRESSMVERVMFVF